MCPKTNIQRAEDYAQSKWKETRKYIQAEISVINNVHDYELGHEFLEQLPIRIKRVVMKTVGKKDFEEFSVGREIYLYKVGKYLRNRGMRMSVQHSTYCPGLHLYSSTLGSFWESFGRTLGQLSADILHEI